MTTRQRGSVPIGQLLLAPRSGELQFGADTIGFAGVHGGLTTAVLTASMQERVPDRRLQSVSADFLRPTPVTVNTNVELIRDGRSASFLNATAAGVDAAAGQHAVRASAVFSAARDGDPPADLPHHAEPAPAAPPPRQCELVDLATLVPFARHTEIRAVGPNRPFSGAADAELLAWIRFTDDDRSPDELRLIVLLDSLAPSVFATATRPTIAPSVRLTVHPSAGLRTATEPWLLVRATARQVSSDGWFTEQIDGWTPQGVHVGVGYQLRLLSVDHVMPRADQ